MTLLVPAIDFILWGRIPAFPHWGHNKQLGVRMSIDVLKIIPGSPSWICPEGTIQSTIEYLQKIVDPGCELKVQITDEIRFIDPGSNLRCILCPSCMKEIHTRWWQQAMSKSYKTAFSVLLVSTPCCATSVSLNDLLYDWPAGFARISFEITGPQRELKAEEIAELEIILGIKTRQIWEHD